MLLVIYKYPICDLQITWSTSCFRDQLPDLRTIIMYGEIPEEDGVLSWEEFLNIGNSGN